MNKDELTTDGTNNNANGQTVPKMEVEVSFLISKQNIFIN